MFAAALCLGLSATLASAGSGAAQVPDSVEACIPDPLSDECVPVPDAPEGWSLELQDTLKEYSTQVREAVGEHPGFADVGLDFSRRAVQVYFHGGLPDSIDQIARNAWESDGVIVERVETAYGSAALERSIERLAERLDRDGIAWSYIGSDLTYSGLQVGLVGQGAEANAASGRTLSAASLVIPGVPVTTALGAEVVEPLSRNVYGTPFRGGARIYIPDPYSDDVEACTTGFSMISQDAIQYLLTAGHCTGYHNDWTITTGSVTAPRYVGTTKWIGVLEETNNLDAILVRLQPSDTATPRIFTGTYSTSSSVVVSSAYAMDIGEVGCMSGATMGTVCQIKRSGAPVFESNLDGRNTWAFSAYSTYGATVPIVAGGDSGGPVYRVKADGTVHGYGIIRGGTAGLPCPATTNPDVSPNCYANVHVTPINRIMTALTGHGVSSVSMMYG